MTHVSDSSAAEAARSSVPRSLVHAVFFPVQAWRRRRNLRRMLDLDDHMLDDIGVTRAEVEWASGLPLLRNAALDLHHRASERRRGRRRGR